MIRDLLFYFYRLLQQQAARKASLGALRLRPGTSGKEGVNGGHTGGAPMMEEEDDGKLAADIEFRMMASALAAQEQQDYCNKYAVHY